VRVVFSAGEASGDAYAAALIRSLRAQGFTGDIAGIGGPGAVEAGMRVVARSDDWGAISIIQGILVSPRVLQGVAALKRELSAGERGWFVPIDFGYANVRLAKFARRKGWRVLYFIPPGSWKRDTPARDLPNLCDLIVTPFPWSAETLSAAGAEAHFFGHPLKQLLARSSGGGSFEGLAVLPGSRPHEWAEMAGPFGDAARALGMPIRVGLAPTADAESFRHRYAKHYPPQTEWVRGVSAAVEGARLALVCSGTATLETALRGTPMVIGYRLPRINKVELAILGAVKGFRIPEFVGLPNILLQRSVVPEFVQDNMTVPALIEGLRQVSDPAHVERQREAFREIDAMLGPSDAIDRTAALLLSQIGMR
jgi:lipid-A-disaccharide synthase